jgi:hypothetical protein
MPNLVPYFQVIVATGLLSLGVALLCTLMFLRGYHMLAAPILGALLIVPGCSLGLHAFCVPGGGNLCGLGGIFGTGPLAFTIGVLAYVCGYKVWHWATRE